MVKANGLRQQIIRINLTKVSLANAGNIAPEEDVG